MIGGLALIALVALASLGERAHAAGGIAEMKALTGDAPYMGAGNLEQAPEYFGDAAYRQYYQNPAYGYAPSSPWSNYAVNARNSYYGGGGYPQGSGYYPGGNVGGNGATYTAPVVPPSTPILGDGLESAGSVGVGSGLGGGGGFYKGGGNDWVKQRV